MICNSEKSSKPGELTVFYNANLPLQHVFKTSVRVRSLTPKGLNSITPGIAGSTKTTNPHNPGGVESCSLINDAFNSPDPSAQILPACKRAAKRFM